MTELEFILVAVSILLALAMTRLLDAGFVNVQAGGDWILSAWIVNRLFSLVILFWGFRTLLGDDLTIPFIAFLFVFLSPVTYYFQALTLAPTGAYSPGGGGFESSAGRRPFAVLACVNALNNAYIADMFEVPVPTGALVFAAALLLSGYWADTRRSQAFVVLGHSALLLGGIARPVIENL